jgi:hypothetical protein
LPPEFLPLDAGFAVGVLRRFFESHQLGLLGDALDDAVHQAAKVEELAADDANIYNPKCRNDGRYERPTKY